MKQRKFLNKCMTVIRFPSSRRGRKLDGFRSHRWKKDFKKINLEAAKH